MVFTERAPPVCFGNYPAEYTLARFVLAIDRQHAAREASARAINSLVVGLLLVVILLTVLIGLIVHRRSPKSVMRFLGTVYRNCVLISAAVRVMHKSLARVSARGHLRLLSEKLLCDF